MITCQNTAWKTKIAHGMGAPYFETIVLHLMAATAMCCSLEKQRDQGTLVVTDHHPEAQQGYKNQTILLEDSKDLGDCT